jgi:ketosteroid isomerase-like protein
VPEGNLDVLRRAVEAINAGDAEAAVAVTHPDAVLEPLRSATEGAFVGHDGARRFIADTNETFDLFRLELSEVRDLGDDRVLFIGTITVRGRGSGVEAPIPAAAIAEFRDGLLWRYHDFGDARRALAAAGLED